LASRATSIPKELLELRNYRGTTPMVSYDPYLNWLGIPPHEQPPNFYRLLGVVLFESNSEVIEKAADRQSLRVGAYRSGPYDELCQQLLSEIAMARLCLLDPQQKVAYDGKLLNGLAQRGERTVAAAPPPASPTAPQAFGSPPQQFTIPSPQFNPVQSPLAPSAGMGPFQPAQNPMPGPAMMPLPGTAMPAAMPIPTAMPTPQLQPQPMMPMPTGMVQPQQPTMPLPGFAATLRKPSAPIAFPATARSLPATGTTPTLNSPVAANSPTHLPAAPQTPIEELEELAIQSTRHRFPKKKKKVEYTKEIILGGVVTAAGVLLFVIYAAIKSQDKVEHGFDAIIKVEKPVDNVSTKLAEELKKKKKEIETAKAKEIETQKKAAMEQASRAKKRFNVSDNERSSIPKAHDFGPPNRAMDGPASGHLDRSAPPSKVRDAQQDIGGVDDPVMEKPPAP
jgi:hypothetical protein